MAKRYQRGSVKLQGKSWVGMWCDNNGKRPSLTLGLRSGMSKTQARQALQEHLNKEHVNDPEAINQTMAGFLDNVFFKIKGEKWRESAADTTKDRINYHLRDPYHERRLSSFTREELQTFLAEKATTLGFKHGGSSPP